MYYLALAGFFVSVLVSFKMGEMVGRNGEQMEQRRKREWQYRIDDVRRGK